MTSPTQPPEGFAPPPETKAAKPVDRPFRYLGLLLATLAAVSFFGAMFFEDPDLTPAARIVRMLTFPATLISILLAHEMGHYLASRRLGVDASLPYFIPAPVGVGTFGAFIRIRQPIRKRLDLMIMGSAGPLAGFALALPLAVAGVYLSRFMPIQGFEGFKLGDSLGFYLLGLIIKGSPPQGQDLILHPIAFAAWLGFFVTSLNLLPVSQLDGGHVLHSMSPRAHKIVSRIMFIGLLAWGLFGDFPKEDRTFYLIGAVLLLGVGISALFYVKDFKRLRKWIAVAAACWIAFLVVENIETSTVVWVVWSTVVFWIGLDHPPAAQDDALSGKSLLPGWLCALVFVLTFIPMPIGAM